MIDATSRCGVSAPGSPPKVNQDIYFIRSKEGPERHYFGVCDGHGANGHLVSGFLKTNLPDVFMSILQSSGGEYPNEMLEETYERVSNKLLGLKTFNINLSGSTAVSCYMDGPKVYIANVGDSRAIVVRRKSKNTGIFTKALSRDHKVDDPIEKQRILAAGGRIDSFRGTFWMGLISERFGSR